MINNVRTPPSPYLHLVKHRIRCRATEIIKLHHYKGAAFHGGFGHALKTISSHYYNLLYEPGDKPKPCVLLPPLDTFLSYDVGHEFHFEITLVGRVAEYFPVCRDAIEYLGRTMGFGENRGKFAILGVETSGSQPPVNENNHEDQNLEPVPANDNVQLNLFLQTNLRLKDNDKLVRTSPSFAIFFSRLLGRLNSLSLYYGDGSICCRDEKLWLLAQAAHIATQNANTLWEDWSRYSGRQKQWMVFGGLTGQITYAGNLTPFLPYLALGAWSHVGGKTSFGLGKFTMEVLQ